MTAVSLFDLLAGRVPGGTGAAAPAARLDDLAGKLIESSLSDLDRVREYEKQFGPRSYDDEGLALARSIYGLYEEWSRDAEQVLGRVRRLRSDGHQVAGIDSLEDAFARVRARLGLTIDQVARAVEDAGQGRAVPIHELRNELRTRNRA